MLPVLSARNLPEKEGYVGRRPSWREIVLLALVAAFVFLPAIAKSGYLTHIMLTVALTAFYGTAWNILAGFGGQMSLGHAVFVGIGAYTSTILYKKLGVPPLIGMFASGLISALFAMAVGFALFKLRAAFFTLSTMALLKVTTLLVIYFRELTSGNLGIAIPQTNKGLLYLYFEDKNSYFYIVVVMLFVALLLASKIKRSRLGLSLLALRDDHDAAESLGIDTHMTKVYALAIGAFLISFGGTMYAQYVLYIDPGSAFAMKFGVEMALVTMLGGLGVIMGPVVGAALLVPIDALLRAKFGGGTLTGLNLVIYGLVMIALVQYFPEGIVPKLVSLARKKDRKGSSAEAGTKLCVGEGNAAAFSGERDVLSRAKSDKNVKDILEVDSLTVRFSGLVAVNNLSFKVRRGEILGIIGPNGAGKTTVFNAVTGFVPRSKGRICYMGREIRRNTKPHRLSRIGLTRTFQAVKPFRRATLLDNVLMGSIMHRSEYDVAKKDAENLLDLVGLMEHANELPTRLTIASQKRLDMARALATDPRILMLDEPMAGLNASEVDEMMALVRRIADQGVTVVIIEHVMKAVMNLCNRVVVLDNGEKIAEGTPHEVANNQRVIDVYLGEKSNA